MTLIPVAPIKRCEAIGEAVTDIYAESEQGRADEQNDHFEIERIAMARGVRAQRDRDGNRTGADRQRKREGVKRAAKNIARVYVVVDLIVGIVVIVFLLEHVPAGDDHDHAAADLHNRKRNSEERQNVSADQSRNDQEDKTVERDALREQAT